MNNPLLCVCVCVSMCLCVCVCVHVCVCSNTSSNQNTHTSANSGLPPLWVLIYRQLNPGAVRFEGESDYPENQREEVMLYNNSRYLKKQTSSKEVQALQKYIYPKLLESFLKNL